MQAIARLNSISEIVNDPKEVLMALVNPGMLNKLGEISNTGPTVSRLRKKLTKAERADKAVSWEHIAADIQEMVETVQDGIDNNPGIAWGMWRRFAIFIDLFGWEACELLLELNRYDRDLIDSVINPMEEQEVNRSLWALICWHPSRRPVSLIPNRERVQ